MRIILENLTNIQWEKVNSFIGNATSKSLGFCRPCPICGSLDSKKVLELNNFQFYSDSKETPKRFDVTENMCLKCFTLYLNPCYSNYGFSALFAEAGQSYGSMLAHTHAQIDWLSNYGLLNDGAHVLDVGCYDGSFLSRLPNNVIKLGVDIDEPAVERGRDLYKEQNIQFFLGDFETFLFSGPEPDAITMYHVLEHLPRPVEVLKKLRSIAKSSTGLIIEVPVIENGKTNDINGFFSIQHATHFSRNSLHNCIELAGWAIEEHYETPDYNGCRILAYPQPEVHLDYQVTSEPKDWIELNSNLSAWHNAVEDVEKIIQQIAKCGRFVIWGGGAHTEFLYQTTSFFHIHHQADFIIVDSDPMKHGKTWRGIPIYDSSIVNELDWSSTNLLISSYGGQEAIAEAADSFNVPEKNIIRLYNTIRRY